MSVIIPAFNAESRIRSTVLQLERQTFTDFEVVVVDDGSADDTASIVASLRPANFCVRLVEQDNKGLAAARNSGVEAATGEVFAFLDDDDLWAPEKLELQLARLDASPGVAVVSCYSALVDIDGRLTGWRWGGRCEGDVYREMLEWDMVSGGSVAMVAREPLEAAGGFDVSLPDRADWDMWIRLARHSHFAFVPRILVGYTRRVGGMSGNHERMVTFGRAVLEKARRDDPSITESAHRDHVARDTFGVACVCLVDEQPGSGWVHLIRALRLGPGTILRTPRRWGVVALLALAAIVPTRLYRKVVMASLGRAAFGLNTGDSFHAITQE